MKMKKESKPQELKKKEGDVYFDCLVDRTDKRGQVHARRVGYPAASVSVLVSRDGASAVPEVVSCCFFFHFQFLKIFGGFDKLPDLFADLVIAEFIVIGLFDNNRPFQLIIFCVRARQQTNSLAAKSPRQMLAVTQTVCDV